MQQPQVVRKLAAIVAADVAGYSRLMGADEEGTLAQLKGHRRALVNPKIREHRGTIVKTTGDGMLLEFASAVDAVRLLGGDPARHGRAQRQRATREDGERPAQAACQFAGIRLLLAGHAGAFASHGTGRKEGRRSIPEGG